MKRLAARTSHTPNDTHDHSELTASDVSQTDGSLKRALDVFLRGGSFEINIDDASEVKIANLAMATPGNEESYSFQDNMKQVMIRSRVLTDVQFAFTSGESGTNFITLKAGCSLSISSLDFNSKVFYAQASTATTLEIIELYD